ncbi:sigma-70 family RNA polymerase sigma factor [soil metagenome]
MAEKVTNTLLINDEEVEWVNLAKTDPNAFKPLYELHFKRVYVFILRRVGDKDTAGDLTQQVFLKALLNIGKYEHRGIPFSAWLFRIALNQCTEFFRQSKRARTIVLEDGLVETLYEEITADQTRLEWETCLPSILEKLGADDLQVIELRFFEGNSFKEVGEVLGISETYAKVRTYRILDKMKKLFLKRE